MHHRRRMHARLIARRLVEEFESVREGQIRILAAQQGRRNGSELLAHDHRGSLGGPRRPGILGIGHESKLSGARVFDAGNSGNFGVRRTIFQASVESSGNLSKFHRHLSRDSGQNSDCNGGRGEDAFRTVHCHPERSQPIRLRMGVKSKDPLQRNELCG